MLKLLWRYEVYIGLLVIGLATPFWARAAQLTFVPADTAADGALTVEVRLDPEAQTLNAVDGVVALQGELAKELKVTVETGGSLLTLWPVRPDYLSSDQAIRFVGGTPGGFSQAGQLFRLRLSAPRAGTVTLAYLGGSAYLNDGRGTAQSVFNRSLTVKLGAALLATATLNDTDRTPPTFDMLAVGRDPSVYGGRYFISFHASDDSSGVDKYRVQEGESISEVKDGIYVLRDQSRRQGVTITAYDQAGNSSQRMVAPETKPLKNAILIIIALGGGLAAALAGFYVYKKFKK